MSRAKKKHRIPAIIRSVTCEGMGLHLENGSHELMQRGCFVVIRFSNGHRNLELPGQVAWAAKESQDPFDVGIAFRLEFTSAVMRQAYARWVVDSIRAGRGSLGSFPSSEYTRVDRSRRQRRCWENPEHARHFLYAKLQFR